MSNVMTVDNVIPRTDIVKHADRLGAEIKHIKISDDLSDEVIAAINRLLLEHKVIFFRDQEHLDDAQQQRFAIRLGLLIPQQAMVDTKSEGVTAREMVPERSCRRADQMNMDDGSRVARPKISILRGAAIPPFGGDVVWSNTAAAYLDLPDPLRMLADNLWAVRCAAFDCTVTEGATEADKRRLDDVSTGTIYETTHPVVRVHPETGERVLSLGRSVQNFIGLQRYPSQKLFELLQSYLTAPENTVRWNWKSGDVAIWDNRATERYPVNEVGAHLAMGPAAIGGDMPRIKALKSSAAEAA
ncbi:TauD/TfdA dioxygenase family protein [Bradyrhizobium elkanii]|uniref:TauD/TfdA dioxygenase family protein n=1 Tax=Bradyrhizobium elkanii TaxID=29448 RepID=UPI00216A28B6|nr:TauD/TfdA family dioxygenase [Bradyrhizobium elkanii]MCS3519229.1 taurine dioxygenase [Bradyrhizobium elkanii]MCS4066887.1 taurine dioxygenase [Bradyrhizobium elkanii]MCS4082422.1 taurine dioxygenase [Bradyrhizobium elkanii]MCW2127964.1 taurine dioxygenase [Bradyrhizobium elkanii]MCW2174705.1 taurine dioxygenase [Bradyrhizobium elkanii]